MNLFQTIAMSIVEGISEFLPISSTGHLIITSSILRITQSSFVKDFEIFIQLGAILAVVVLYWKSVSRNTKVWKKILAAFIPTGIIGFLLFKLIKNYLLGNLYITLTSLFIGGIALILLELIYKEKEHHVSKIEDVSYRNAIVIGIIQSIAIVPGVSRSAATIIGALFLGTKRKTAAEFSFLLAVPTMLAATSLDLVKSNFNYSSWEWTLLVIGFIGSFISALIVVKWFLKYVQTHNFILFGIYRVIASIAFYFLVIR